MTHKMDQEIKVNHIFQNLLEGRYMELVLNKIQCNVDIRVNKVQIVNNEARNRKACILHHHTYLSMESKVGKELE